MPTPSDRKYTKEHEWVTTDGAIGITDYAQDQLGDVVFVDLPELGESIAAEQKFGEIESVKAVSELFAPVSGKVAERNEGLEDNPQWVNDSPYDEGWMLKITLSDPTELDGLLTAEEYDNFTQGLAD